MSNVPPTKGTTKEEPETTTTQPTMLQPQYRPSVYRGPEPILTPPSPPPKRELTKEEREFLNALGELVSSAQELSYVLASIDPELLQKYSDLQELIDCARNVVRAVYRFHKLIKKRSKPEKTEGS